MKYGEQSSLDALKRLKNGTYYGEDFLDSGDKIQVKVTVTNKEFIVDLRNNPKQDTGPNNASYDGTVVSAQMAFKGVTSSDFICNAGTFRPLKVICDEGSMFNPIRPTAQGIYYETDIRSYDGDALLIDFGCVYNGYNSDFTRTYFFKEVSDSHRNIYNVVKEANQIGKNISELGTDLHDIDDKVTGHLESSNYKNCIAHRTGHGLGMDVHEDPYVTRGNNQKLEEGMVITIEPSVSVEGGGVLVSEENIVIRDGLPELLTKRATHAYV